MTTAAAGRAMVAAAAVALGGCAGVQSALDPAGPAAARIADLWWIMLAATLIPAIVVIGVILYAVRRAQTGRGAGLGELSHLALGSHLVLPLTGMRLRGSLVHRVPAGSPAALSGRSPGRLNRPAKSSYK